jgi:hypothetical protein
MGKSKTEECYVNVNAAISHYNRNRKKGDPKMTQASLSKVVFKDGSMSEDTKMQYLSGWQQGNEHITSVRLKHIIRIHHATGLSYNELLPTSKIKK